MKEQRLGFLCFLIGLAQAAAIFFFMYLFIIKINFISVVSSGVVSIITGVYISEKLANYFYRKELNKL